MPANFLNRTALPSITGLAARAPILPRPSTAVPLVITADQVAARGVVERGVAGRRRWPRRRRRRRANRPAPGRAGWPCAWSARSTVFPGAAAGDSPAPPCGRSSSIASASRRFAGRMSGRTQTCNERRPQRRQRASGAHSDSVRPLPADDRPRPGPLAPPTPFAHGAGAGRGQRPQILSSPTSAAGLLIVKD